MPNPSVRGALLAKLDELVGMVERDLEEIRAVTDQLEPRESSKLAETSSR